MAAWPLGRARQRSASSRRNSCSAQPSGRSSVRPVASLCSGAAKLGFQASRGSGGSRGPSLSVYTLGPQLHAPGGLALQRGREIRVSGF